MYTCTYFSLTHLSLPSSPQEGFHFERVADILSMKTLPKAVRATKAWKGSSPESSVEENELLIVKSSHKKLKGKRLLKVYSPTCYKRKELPESCAGHFSTKPYNVRLYLPEIVEHVVDPFPMEAVLFFSVETAFELPTYLISNTVTMCSISTESSLIASDLYAGGSIDTVELIDVPFDLDIEVQVMKPKDEEETEQLYESTRKLFEQFNPTRIGSYMNSQGNGSVEAQMAFYTMVREGKELAGECLTFPPIYSRTLIFPVSSYSITHIGDTVNYIP